MVDPKKTLSDPQTPMTHTLLFVAIPWFHCTVSSFVLVRFNAPEPGLKLYQTIGVRRGVTKMIEDGRRLPALRAGHPRNGRNAVSGWPTLRPYKGRAWRAKVKL
jgi:hypothetical protein